MILLEHA
jgi:hypothetical protein